MTPSETDLKALARRVFGREIDDRQAEKYRARLPHMARAKALLQRWEDGLSETAPMTVYRVPTATETASETATKTEGEPGRGGA